MRYLTPHVVKDLRKKMVFLGGPRQVGKTTLAQGVLEANKAGGVYLNWDADEDRRAIMAHAWSTKQQLLVFDEIHKFRRWKNWLKGLYDTRRGQHSILVTGSARLDVYRRGGDSLLGRYHYWRLHPFDLTEIPKGMTSKDALARLMRVGGFPEPFLDGDEREAKRWRRERFDRVLRDDVRDLEAIRDITTLGLFLDALRTRVGGLVVLSNIAEELQVAQKTLKHWLDILERMYLVFVVRPWTRNLPRAVVKPPKVYFYDNMDVIGDEGARFENLVATHLLKRLQFMEDHDGDRYELRYIRDKEGREVDFAVVKNGHVAQLIEAKHADKNVALGLRYYAERLKPDQAVQLVATLKRPFDQGRVSVRGPLDVLTQPLG